MEPKIEVNILKGREKHRDKRFEGEVLSEKVSCQTEYDKDEKRFFMVTSSEYQVKTPEGRMTVTIQQRIPQK